MPRKSISLAAILVLLSTSCIAVGETITLPDQQKDHVISYISAESSTIADSGTKAYGWYTSNTGVKCFKLGFKQAERDTPSPLKVATATIVSDEAFNGTSAVQLELNAHLEAKPGSTAWYKSALSAIGSGQDVKLSVGQSKGIFHGFAMKIERRNFSLPDTGELIFEQFWQGSPFHPPVALAMWSKKSAIANGWNNVSDAGSFGLIISDDDHLPLGKNGSAKKIELGPVTVGEWLQWVVEVRPSPSGADGLVRVSLNGKIVADQQNIRVGYTPNKRFGNAYPSKFFQSVDVLLYRQNGETHQKVFFDDIRLADTFEGASPRKDYLSKETCTK